MDVRQPPWANELLARNRKVGRNIWSTSDIHQGQTFFSFEGDRGQDENHGRKRTEDNKAVDPSFSPLAKATTTVLGTGNSIQEDNNGFCDHLAKVDNLALGGDMIQRLWTLSNTSGEESIIEYGPGIVSKLRSKYQSLSDRQNSSRSSLRRSTSLEYSLDFIKSETPTPTLPSPREREESPSPVIPPVWEQDGIRALAKMTLNVQPHPTYGKVSTNSNSNTVAVRPMNRGRTGNSEQLIRMRRARSVDALHHAEYTAQEEEILEKFKTVVLPKEEVVIIEMSKPRLNIGSLGNHLRGTTNETKLGATHHYAISSLVTPEYELPPHDIVRDTAKIFETNPGAHWKKVGNALRVCQSPSLSPASSLCSSPLPFPLSPTQAVTATEKKIQIVSAQPQRAAVFDQNEDFPTRTMNNNQQNNKMGSKTAGVDVVANPQINSPAKQIGVIRPTVNGVQKSFSGSNLSRPAPPPPLPPRAALPLPVNRAFQFITAPTKPAISPKPLLPSKPQGLLEHVKVSSPRNMTVDEPKTREKSPELSIGTVFPSAPFPRLETPIPLELNLNLSLYSPKNLDGGLPVSSKPAPPLTREVKSCVVGNKNNAFPVMLKPVVGHIGLKSKESLQAQGLDLTKSNDPNKSIVPESQNNFSKQPYNDTPSPKTNVKDLDADVAPRPTYVSTPQKNTREGDALKQKRSSPPPVRKDPEEKSTPPVVVSHLRTHQKQKSQQSSGGGTMVFNFTSRNKVPDYIEDDGLHRVSASGADELTDDAVDGFERIDPKLIFFIGANVIINGKSSIQKKPKSQKMNIRFNEAGTTTFEYPSETSVLNEESNDSGSNNNFVAALSGGGGGLSNYTPSKVAPNSYQLGFYGNGNDGTDANSNRKSPIEPKNIRTGESGDDATEDYLKPDTGSTTWSNETGGADILF